MIIHFIAKCEDKCCITDRKGERYDGYVPSFLDGAPDYITLKIDTETGVILNWPMNVTEKFQELLIKEE